MCTSRVEWLSVPLTLLSCVEKLIDQLHLNMPLHHKITWCSRMSVKFHSESVSIENYKKLFVGGYYSYIVENTIGLTSIKDEIIYVDVNFQNLWPYSR